MSSPSSPCDRTRISIISSIRGCQNRSFSGVAFVLLGLWPRAKWMPVLAIASILLFVLLAWRGMPAAVVPDITYARDYLENNLRPEDSLTVNADARRLGLYFPNKFA